jgi:DNA processing protein
MSVEYLKFRPDELVGSLNEVERKYAPQQLFIAGDPNILRSGARVSIVGSREASEKGLIRARRLARILVERGAVVVSGLARGIDTAAHKSAIDAGGKTVAVIGTPLDKVYPRENEALQSLIMRMHLCVSQFSVGYPTQPRNFPMRNRTMALLSDATVIIEAGETSGSLSQGWEALRLGRGLFISKWLTENQSLKWPIEMLGYGARILSDETIDEFCEELPERKSEVVLDELAF